MYQKYQNTTYDNTLITNIFQKVYFTENFKLSNLVENYIITDEDNPEILSLLLYKKPEYSWFILLFNNIQNYYEDWPLQQNILTDYIKNKYNKTTIVLNPIETFNINFKNVYYVQINNIDYSILSYDKNLNKITINKIFVNNFSSIFLLTKNKTIIKEIKNSNYNISLDDRFGIHHFKNNQEIVSPYEKVFSNITYLQNYSSGEELFAVTNQQYETEKNDKKRNIFLFKPEIMDQIVTEFYSVLKGSTQKTNILNFISNQKLSE